MNHKSKHDYNFKDFGSVSTFIDYLNSNLKTGVNARLTIKQTRQSAKGLRRKRANEGKTRDQGA